jgi:restriction system protein
MTIPKSHELYADVLSQLTGGGPVTVSDLRKRVIDRLDLTDEELVRRTARGSNQVAANVNWAISHLAQAEAIHRPERGVVQISDLGKELASTYPEFLDREVIRATEGYVAWQARTKDNKQTRRMQSDAFLETDSAEFATDADPISLMSLAAESIRTDVASELLDRIRSESPAFLEKLVLKLLLAMGYGVTVDDLDHTGRPGDEGIDGIVKQDLLGLEKIYVQAKRYRDQSSIGGETIQAFMGALSMKNATKGVFITTSRFSSAALKYVEELRNQSIVLIDGPQLVSFMIDHGVGITEIDNFKVIAIDENFFGLDD